LIRDGAFADKTQVLPERPIGADTISGPGWASILTGVWADKHGVRDNHFEGTNLQQFPHFFRRLKEVHPQAFTASYVTWEPINRFIVSDADDSRAMATRGSFFQDADARGAHQAVRLLTEGKPDALFIHFDHVDGTGHRKGLSPESLAYIEAIEQTDDLVGQILAAMRGRKTYSRENWLVLVCSDNGGKGKDHAGGHQVPEVREVFLMVIGPAMQRGRIDGSTFLVDVAATALTHLGVPLDRRWRLDGHLVGLLVNDP
jgi:predicted AlkP superfamily pyrophosphatase or phosphodiesterase